MNATRDHRLHWAHPLSILVECPGDTCDGHLSLRTTGGHDARAIGRCPTCGERAVLRAGVLQPYRRRRAGSRSEPGR